MWFAVSCMPSSDHSLFSRGRQKHGVSQTAPQGCAYDALRMENDSSVVLKNYRKTSAARNSTDEFYTARKSQSPVGYSSSDISPDLPERTHNSSTSSSGYHSGREQPNPNVTMPTAAHDNNDTSFVDLDSSPRVNRTFDENLIRQGIPFRTEKRPRDLQHRNSYHGNWDLNNGRQGGGSNYNHRNSFHSNRDFSAESFADSSYLQESSPWEKQTGAASASSRLPYTKSFGNVDSGRNDQDDNDVGATWWPLLYQYGTERDVSPREGSRNPLGVLSPAAAPVPPYKVSPPRYKLWGSDKPPAPCHCDNEHCDYYWSRHSGAGAAPQSNSGYPGSQSYYSFHSVSSSMSTSVVGVVKTLLLVLHELE